MLPGQKKKSQKQIKFEHRSKIVLNLIKTKPRITNEQLSIVIGIDSRFIKILLKEMKEFIKRSGANIVFLQEVIGKNKNYKQIQQPSPTL